MFFFGILYLSVPQFFIVLSLRYSLTHGNHLPPPGHYGCRNGAKFNIFKFYSYSTFIHSYLPFIHLYSPFVYSHSTFVYSYPAFVYSYSTSVIHIQHLCVFSITIYSSSTFMLSTLHLHSAIIFIQNVTFVFYS